MKLTIDTTNKIISISDKTTLKEFIDTLKKLLPNDEWEQYSIETPITQNWNIPTLPITYPSPTIHGTGQPYYMSPPATCQSNSATRSAITDSTINTEAILYKN